MDSPRLRAYLRRITGTSGRRADRLWAALVRGGLPFIEPVPGDRGSFRVTWLWRPGAGVRAPSLYTPAADLPAGEGQLRRLGATDTWFCTLRLPRRTRALYAFSPRSPPGPSESGGWEAYFRSLVPDPYNPERLTMAKDPEDPTDVEASVSVLTLPGAPAQPWRRGRGPTRWTVTVRRFRSAHLPGARRVWVFTPPGFDPGRRRYDLVVGLDGVAFQSIVPTPGIVEHLVATGRLRPTVLVLVGNARGARELELLHSVGFGRFLATELGPWLRRQFGLTTPPGRTVLAGSSLGGLAAAFAAHQYPRVFGNVVALSGAFSWSDSGELLGAPTLMTEYARAPRRSIRFYLAAGTLERTVYPGTQASLLAEVRHLRDVLVAKGYSVDYAEFVGGHDHACWANALADGLRSLLGP